ATLTESSCARIPEPQREFAIECAHAIGHDAIFRPIATSDYVTGPRRCNTQARTIVEKTGAVRIEYKFGARLRSAVRIAAAKFVGLAITPDPFPVLIRLVTGNVDKHAK